MDAASAVFGVKFCFSHYYRAVVFANDELEFGQSGLPLADPESAPNVINKQYFWEHIVFLKLNVVDLQLDEKSKQRIDER